VPEGDALCTFVVFDLEFTSWQGALEQDWAAPGQLRDGVQIGVLRLHEDFSVAEEFTEAEQGFQPHAAEAVDIADASNDARKTIEVMSILMAAKVMQTGSIAVPTEGHSQPVRMPATMAVRTRK
jgi:hypothetical protein